LAGIVALGAWSLAACSSDKNNGGNDGGPDGGGATSTGGKTGTGGSGGTSSGGSAGKSTGGSAGSTGGSGTGGESTDSGAPTIIDAGFDGGSPSVKITAPKDLETIVKDADHPTFPKISVAFKVGNFELAAPETDVKLCPKGSCGHVHINVDGIDCNISAAAPYNVAGNSTPLDIDLSLCKAGVAGAHTVVISLHNTDHTDVTVAGKLVSDTITINTPLGDAGSTTDAGSNTDSGS
jgi:hypothetical protein